MDVSFKLWSISIPIFSLTWAWLKNRISKIKYEKIVHVINKAICDNQIAFVQYSYLASIKHKYMKEEFYGKKRPEKLDEYCKELERHLDDELGEAFKINFDHIKDFFQIRAKLTPRICVKAHNDAIQIVDLLRDKQTYKSPMYPIDSNSGFKNVYNTGQYYIENNIPKKVTQGSYKNPRLHHNAHSYKLYFWENMIIKLFKKDDERWTNYWQIPGSTDRPEATDCYKSTIIIPMTLDGNRFKNPEFKKSFNIDKNTERAIYGYLCIDYHHKDFFNDLIDSRVGYVFADIMSLYLINHLQYMDNSKTYHEVQDFLTEQKK